MLVEDFNATVCCIAFWAVSYFLCHVPFLHKSGTLRLCFTGIIHSISVWILCSVALLNPQPCIYGGETTNYHHLASIFSGTFFIVDCIPNCIYPVGFPMSIIHHLLSAYALLQVPITREWGAEITTCLLLMEISNPFMCLNMMLKEEEAFDSWIFAINERIFEFSFIFMRIFVGGWYTYKLLSFRSFSEYPVMFIVALGFIHLFTLMFTPLILRDIYRRDYLGERRGEAAQKKNAKKR